MQTDAVQHLVQAGQTTMRLYLAGPMVFEPDPVATFAAMKAICRRHGVEGVAPLDNQLDLSGSPGRDLVARIVAADIALMHRCDAGLFCLDGFRRGPEMDPGTAFELGTMHALGKPLMGWTRDVRDYPARVRAFFADTFGLALVQDRADAVQSGAWRDPDGMLVHSEGCVQNAMCDIAIERSGGAVHAHPEWAVAFGQAVAALATRRGGFNGRSTSAGVVSRP